MMFEDLSYLRNLLLRQFVVTNPGTSAVMYYCVSDLEYASFYYDFETVPTEWYFFLLIIFISS